MKKYFCPFILFTMLFCIPVFADDDYDYYSSRQTFYDIEKTYENGQEKEALEKMLEWISSYPSFDDFLDDIGAEDKKLVKKVFIAGLKTLYYTPSDKLIFDKTYEILSNTEISDDLAWVVKLYRSFYKNEEITWYTGDYILNNIAIGFTKDGYQWPIYCIKSILPSSDGYVIKFAQTYYHDFEFFVKPGYILYPDCSFALEITSVQPNSVTAKFKKKKPKDK